MTDRNLLEKAAEVMQNSYSPYSRIKTGAAIEYTDGTTFVGCNVENAAISSSMCAEAVAISAAISSGKRDFKRIAIISESSSYSLPCGACRQLLNEFSPEVELLCARADGRYVSYPLSALLPMPYGKEQTSNA